MKALTNIARILVGVLFIFSGLIKANDPLGFSYKMDEYFEVFGVEWLLPLSLFIAITICVVEVILGFALLLGARLKLTLWMFVLMMVFFTFLTFYSAYYNKVTSCGCFGDAIPLTPWQSFYKDVVLCVLLLILIIGRNHINPVVGPKFENVLMSLIIIGTVAFPLYTYSYLPIKDFRPYAIGKNISEGMKSVPDKLKFYYMFKNAKTNETKEFDAWQSDTITWKYLSNRTEVVEKGIEPKVKDFSITNLDGSDYTEDFISNPNYVFLLIEHDLKKTNRGVQGKASDFAQLCANDSVIFIALTSTSKAEIDKFKSETGAKYDFYNTDGTVLKTMIRSNPGLMLIRGGTVVAMWPYRLFPSYNDVKRKIFEQVIRFILKRFLYALLVMWGVVTAVFFLFNILPGDPARLMMGQHADKQSIDMINKDLGRDRPLSTQYIMYLNDLSVISVHKEKDQNSFLYLNDDKYSYTKLVEVGPDLVAVVKYPYLRRSYQNKTKVADIVIETLPETVVLALSAIIIASVLGIILGVFSALYKNSWYERITLAFATIFMSGPSFYLGYLIVFLFAVVLGPYTHLEAVGSLFGNEGYGEGEVLQLKNLILPAITLGLRPLAIIIQLTKGSMLEVLSQDYIRTAKAKGLTLYTVIFKHALKNALTPVITAISGWFAGLLAGAVFVEKVFSWKGIGERSVDALLSNDLPVVMGCVLVIATIFVIINTLVDIIYGLLDPRVRVK